MRFNNIIIFCLLVGSAFFSVKVFSQMQFESISENSENKPKVVSVRAQGIGLPRVNFADGKDLGAEAAANQNNSTAKTLISADFDSDGTTDLITADTAGNLKFFAGNPDSLYPNSPQANKRKVAGESENEAFAASRQIFSLPFAPDFLFAGDFNADGKQDVLAARKSDNVLHLLAGDGAGNFAEDVQIQTGGAITALTTGEIGRRDGQTDVAVAVSGGKSARLLIYEHPEGAFKDKPETVKLAAQANDLAIGSLDADFYGDVAAASGGRLTVVHGRGQAFPWDLFAEYDLKRPAAIIETRVFPFEIAALAVGVFTDTRGESLAMLTTNGTVQTLDAPESAKAKTKSNLQNLPSFKTAFPAIKSEKRLAALRTLVENGADSGTEKLPANRRERENFLLERSRQNSEEFQKLSAAEQTKLSIEKTKIAEQSRKSAKNGFLKTISPVVSVPLARRNLQTVLTDSRLSSAAFSNAAGKIVKVRVSDSGKDELAFLDPNAKKIHLLVQASDSQNSKFKDQPAELISLDAASSPTAILPMRLNADAISDLVVLRENSSAPSTVVSSAASTFVVNSAGDADVCDASECTLRGAINESNVNPGVNYINFNIGGGGFEFIYPETQLPIITNSVTIDATTQPGYDGKPLIQLGGQLLTDGGDGLQINTNDTVVRGLEIGGFKSVYSESEDRNVGGNGIIIFNYITETNARFNIIEGNYIGTDASGKIDNGNDAAGVNIFDSDYNQIGGTNPAARNLLSGSGTDGSQPDIERKSGTGINMVDARNSKIEGNYIGTDDTGNNKINNSIGIFVTGSSNLIGGDAAGAGNTVSGNGDPEFQNSNPDGCYGSGVAEGSAINEDTGEFITQYNTHQGNRIGTNAAGNAPLGNCSVGLATSPRHSSFVGSITESGRNTMSGNHDGGIICSPIARGFFAFRPAKPTVDVFLPEGTCTIVGNNVGTNASGTAAIPNDEDNGPNAVYFFGTLAVFNTDTFSLVGFSAGISANACTGYCNLVSGNTYMEGITHAGPFGEVGIFNNFVGTNKNGTAALPNDTGINVFGTAANRVGGYGTDSSGGAVALGNLISGNNSSAIVSFSDLSNRISYSTRIVQNNLIGTDASGTTALPNNTENDTSAAVLIDGGGVSYFGGVNPLARNVVAGNRGAGVQLFGNLIPGEFTNNYVGVNKQGQPLGNRLDGLIIGARSLMIGGGSPAEGNVIANNGRNGIFVADSSGFDIRRNTIRYNSIYNNGALGIDLTADTIGASEPDGVTANDCQDADGHANGLQNYPILTAPVNNQDGTISVEGALNSKPNSSYTIDFYSNATADPTNYGEGQNYLGTRNITTDKTGLATFLFNSTDAVGSSLKITSTATDVFGNTSEFSCFAGQCAVGVKTDSGDENLRNLAAAACVLPVIIVNINGDQPDSSPANGICDVDLNTTGLQCSLRAAIQTANGKSGFDNIEFNIPGGGVQTITPTSALPALDGPVSMNATTQPGYLDNKPTVEVRGTNAGNASNGLVLADGSGGSLITGLNINRFGAAGIVFRSNENLLRKSVIGLFADGNTIDPNHRQQTGISITGSGNMIGDKRVGNKGNNIITGNIFEQISISSTNAVDNVVIGNDIGLTLSGEIPADFSIDGIEITNGAARNKIGGTTAEETNFIDSFLSYGIFISTKANGNVVTHNAVSGSNVGIGIVGASNNTIGGERGDETKSARNVIGENKVGIFIGDDPNSDNLTGTKDAHGDNFKWRKEAGLKKTNTAAAAAAAETLTLDNKIFGNLIGITPALEDFGNEIGIDIRTAQNNSIGSGAFGYHNFIGGNINQGVLLEKESYHNKVLGNFIGTDITGTSLKPNQDGITVAGTENQIYNNIISGNNAYGIAVTRSADSDPLPTGNTISTNKIGTNGSGDISIANDESGILLAGEKNSVTSNIISGNTRYGIDLRGNNNSVSDNKIGTDASGNAALANNEGGIIVSGSTNNISSNKISGNVAAGIAILRDQTVSAFYPTGNIIQRNFIGTNSNGTAALPNTASGIVLADGANNNTIGGASPNAGNVISGNNFYGIQIQVGAAGGATAPSDNKIQGNFIGTDASGYNAVANGRSGIIVENSRNNLIGGFGASIPFARNIVSGNGQSGIALSNFSTSNRVSGNYIGTKVDGTSPLGNVKNGIFISQGAFGNIIGGLEDNAGNIVAFNGINGVGVSGDGGSGNLIDPNSIFGNGGLGIDIGENGHTPNDLHDADAGPNNLQNYPEITTKQIVNNELVINFKVDSAPAHSAYGADGIYVEFFKSDASGEGENFLGFAYYSVADYNNGAPLAATVNFGDIAALGITASDRITATATDADGNSSEFAPPLAPTAAGTEVGGRILTRRGKVIAGARITLTDTKNATRTVTSNAFGYYKFSAVAAGQTYLIGVMHKGYKFDPATQILSVTNDLTNVNFTAECVAHELHNSEIDNCLEMTAKIKNATEKTISSVRISGAENVLGSIKSLDFENPGVPLTQIDYHPPRTGTINLAPGEEVVYTWHVNAFDAPAKLQFTPVAYGVLDGTEVGASAKKKFNILDKVLLKWGMRPTDGRTSYVSGQNVRADGYIENVSAKDGGEKNFLRVLVYQMPKKNVGGGPRAGHFVENLSVMDEFNADFKRVRGTESALGPAGEILLDAEGKPVQVTVRHEDPTGEFSLINGTPLLNNPNKAFVKRFAPLIFENVFNEFKQRIPYYFPSVITRILQADDDLQKTQNSSQSAENIL